MGHYENVDPVTSERMKRVRSKDTGLELEVRRLLSAEGVKYRLHMASMPGKPDIYIPRLHLAVFVNGCFWHHHDCPKGQRLPARNEALWASKISNNVQRLRRHYKALSEMGIDVLLMWECQKANFANLCVSIAIAYKTLR